MKKKIALVITLLIIASAIWYLESLKARPGAGQGGPTQAISIDTPNAASFASSSSPSSSSASSQSSASALAALAAKDRAAGYAPAIEIADPTGFINASSSFQLKNLVGKEVILLDFWTYSCINCIRTLPYLTAWYGRYHNEGFTIVGIHTPEFDFEKDYNNVQAAVQKFGIHYPVVLDSNYGTWNAYSNHYWPHEYLIDLAGYIVHDQIGEGNYGETEQKIQELLAERSVILGTQTPPMPLSTVSVPSSEIAPGAISPETYFGAARNEYLGNGTPGATGVRSFAAPSSVSLNNFYFEGSWDVEPEYAQTAAPGAVLDYRYQAKGVYWVAGSATSAPIDIEVLRDGAPIPASAAGSDIFYQNGKSYVRVTGNRLYRIIDDAASGVHTLRFIVPSVGLQAYTFTFG